uniref:protein-disulfide reductase DsbD family protein n=1 Tax=Parerythrobacter lutipelagi TaxID=1964208 RepID=UPI0010F7633C|nr:protein-disulfide reductase DsbD domain-containing protein [Parerythrobacter lutipelagi]
MLRFFSFPNWLTRILALAALVLAHAAQAQPIVEAGSQPNIRAQLVAATPATPGEVMLVAIAFDPAPGWHGYWKNPGDAGYGMELEWDLPEGWQAGEPQYPVPQTLLISGLMNHVYKGRYAVLVPVTVPDSASATGVVRIGLDAEWLACTDEICVPEQDRLVLAIAMGRSNAANEQSTAWQAALPPLLDSRGSFTIAGDRLRIAIPLPASLEIGEPHVFIANTDLVRYASPQGFARDGDSLIAELALADDASVPETIEAILAFDKQNGVRFHADSGPVPSVSVEYPGAAGGGTALLWLVLAAVAGGLVLNIMPCVFPILSLKAISLARAGESQKQARHEALAYTAGVVLACIALGGLMLGLRAAGEQVGWAFQLQEPGVVVGLLVLATAITANLAGIFELPGLSMTRGGEPASAFATGLLAAAVATPCTGPFMAAALGAALLLPTVEALVLFAALGFGLALPFLAIGFLPALRNRLPKPGPWMERFRRAMAIPMGLTALALVWLTARLGGQGFALFTLVLLIGFIIALMVVGRLQQRGKMAWPAFALIVAPFALFAAFALPASYSQDAASEADSMLDPAPYSAAALAEARASGRPVFIWFTADWCLTCKVNERVAIEREATKEAFGKAGVIAMRGDWTRRDSAISEYLAQQGAAGVPLYVWYPAGGDAEILPQIVTSDMLVTLATDRSPGRPGIARPIEQATDLD